MLKDSSKISSELQSRMNLFTGILFGIFMLLQGHAAEVAGPKTTLTEILVINQKSAERLNSFETDEKKLEVLKFIPHRYNPNYLSAWYCLINADEQALGGDCEAVSQGEYFHIKDLQQLEKLVEQNRKVNYVTKEILVTIATIPLGIGIYRGFAKTAELIYSGAMAYRATKWGVLGLTFVTEVAINFPLTDYTDEVSRTSNIHGMGEHLIGRQAMVVVEDRVRLKESFKALNKYLKPTRKMIGSTVLMTKEKSNACVGCSRFNFELMPMDIPFY